MCTEKDLSRGRIQTSKGSECLHRVRGRGGLCELCQTPVLGHLDFKKAQLPESMFYVLHALNTLK